MYTIIFSMLMFFSCADKKADLVSEIATIQNQMKQESFPSKENLEKAIALFDEYISTYPTDKESYGFTELKAKYQAANGQYTEAIRTYQDLITTHPNDERNADNLFMQGFIYEEYLQDQEKAKSVYMQFLKIYPKHILAPSAQMSLDNLNLSDEELLQKILKSAK